MSFMPIVGDWDKKTTDRLNLYLWHNYVVVPIARKEDQEPHMSVLNDYRNHRLLDKLSGRPGFVLFSSGTTGAPKAVLHDYQRFMSRFRKPGKAYRTIMFMFFDHIGGWDTYWYADKNGGLPIPIGERTPMNVCAAIQTHGAELLPTTPSFLNMILYTRMYERYDLSSLKVITYGAEPMPQSTLDACARVMPGVILKQTYATSELGRLGTKSEGNQSLWVKVGGEGYETQVRDGILWVRSETSMLGYLNAPQPFDADGWYCTGDQVEQRDGYLRFIGRDSEIINVGGEKVSPVEVESAILEVPGVLDVAVSGEPNALMGQVVTARVVTAEGDKAALRREIVKHCMAKLGKYKTPMRVYWEESIVTERFKRKR